MGSWAKVKEAYIFMFQKDERLRLTSWKLDSHFGPKNMGLNSSPCVISQKLILGLLATKMWVYFFLLCCPSLSLECRVPFLPTCVCHIASLGTFHVPWSVWFCCNIYDTQKISSTQLEHLFVGKALNWIVWRIVFWSSRLKDT